MMLSKPFRNASSVLASYFIAAVALALLASAFAGGAHAQVSNGTSAGPQPTLTDPATREAVRELVSELDDTQVRALLIERMTKEVDRRAAERISQETRGLGEIARDHFHALGRYIDDAIAKVPQIRGGIETAWSNFVGERGDRSVMWFLLSLSACLILGTAAAVGGQRAAGRLDNGVIPAIKPESLAAEAKIAFLTLLARLLPVATFVAAAGVANIVFNGSFPADYDVTGRIISAAAWTGLTVAVARFALSPTLPEWRRCPVASSATDFLVWRIGLAAVLFNFGLGFALWLDRFGSAFSETRFGFWVGVALHLLLIATIWQARRGIRSIVAGSAEICMVRPRVAR